MFLYNLKNYFHFYYGMNFYDQGPYSMEKTFSGRLDGKFSNRAHFCCNRDQIFLPMNQRTYSSSSSFLRDANRIFFENKIIMDII